MTEGVILASGAGAWMLGQLMARSSDVKAALNRHLTARVILYGEAHEAVQRVVSLMGSGSDVAYGFGRVGAHSPEPVNSASASDDDFGHRFAPGTRLIRIDGKRVMVSVSQEKFEYGYIEQMTMTTARRHLSWLKTWVEQTIREHRSDMAKGLPVYMCRGGWFSRICVRPFRRIETIEHPQNVPGRILGDIAEWEAREAEVTGRGENFHIGFLLHGPPGTGKTSTAIAVASHLRRPLYVITPTKAVAASIGDALATVPEGAILLVEECEQLFPVRDGDDKDVDREVATALSHFDGPFSKRGIIRFYTTNHPDRLDPSFRRPGRCDHQYEFPARRGD